MNNKIWCKSMKAKLVREYIELPPKTEEQILNDLKKVNKTSLSYMLYDEVANEDFLKAKLLLAAGADPNIKMGINNNSVLSYACTYNIQIKIIRLLIGYGANVNSRNLLGNTPLIHAINKKNINIIKILLDAEANVNIKNKSGETPLQIASNMTDKDFKIISLLKKYGAK